MKTSIMITGSGLSSKFTLRSACETINSETKNHMFNNFEIKFNTKKEAVKALSEAYQYLHSDLEDWKASNASYRYGLSLSYDAGVARIVQT